MSDSLIGNNIIEYLTDPVVSTRFINYMTVLIIFFTIMFFISNSTYRFKNAYALQSLALSVLIAFIALYENKPMIYLNAGLTFIFKVILFPLIIGRVITRQLKIVEEKEMFMHISFSLIIVGAITIFSYLIVVPILEEASTITKNILPSAFAVIMIGFYSMISKKKANGQLFGLLIIENGMSLAIIATTYEMPIIVELGIFVNKLIAVFVLVIFLYIMYKRINSISTSDLKELIE